MIKTFVGLFSLLVIFHFSEGLQEDAECRKEHGPCTRHVYENIRLAALRSSGCKNFCQCAHASTELDGSVTYMWVRHECPPTTLFDDSLPSPVCNHENKVQCNGDDDDDCREEHGACTQFIYENIRLVAQKSSGCKKFCQCAHASTEFDGSVTYKWVEHTCPAGTLFDNSIRVCNHEASVQCSGSNGQNELTSPAAIVTENDGDVSDDDCFREYGQCSRDQYENIRLVALRRSGCKNFCQCAHASTLSDGSVTYKWVKKTCPAGTLFDESLPAPVCNHDYKVQCRQADDDDDCRSEHGACTKYIYENVRLVALESSGCKNFCQCAHASTELDGSVTYKWVEHTCPAGTLFDNSIRVCNHEASVQCSGSNGQNELTSPAAIVTENDGGFNDDDCFREYGQCSRDQYENVRLVALRSSGCKNFCQCAHASTLSDGSVTYKWVKKTCSAGTLFDESLPAPVCNHDYKVQCRQADDDDDCRSEHGACTKYIYENVRLVALESSGCKNFCQCAHASTELDGSVTYKWVEHTCPAGTLFDNSIRVCNHEASVQCSGSNGQNELTSPAAIVTENDGGFNDEDCFREYGQCSRDQYENVRLVALRSSGCKNFCQCAHASTLSDGSVTYKWVKKTCPAGTLFDESLPAPVCNHDYKVQCRQADDDDDCRSEHGACTQYFYENVRLVALESSGCKNFCQCAHASTELDGSVTYKWVEHTCPAGTLFDNSLPARVCNHEANVRCYGSNEQNELTSPRPIVQETTTRQNGGEGSGDDCFREHGYCSRDQYENVRLVALRSSGCKNFCQCAHASTLSDGSVTYKWVKKTCPAGTLFDESLPAPVCNHAYKVQCPDVESRDCTAEYGVCTKFVYENVRLVPKLSSGCAKFCQCAFASTELDGSVTYKWVEHDCPAGTLFDRNLRVCNYANLVQCDRNSDFGAVIEPVQSRTAAKDTVQALNGCEREHGTCTRGEYEDRRLTALKSSGCQKFCQCAHASTRTDGSVTYRWVEERCPDGTLFDNEFLVCNYPEFVEC